LFTGCVVWGLWLLGRLLKYAHIGSALRYAIPTGNVLWISVEAGSRMRLYPEIWVKPLQYPLAMTAITLAIGTNAGSGTLSATTNPLSATAGVATFAGVQIDKAGTGYTLTAASGLLTGDTSSTFTISAASASKVVFTTQPGGGTAARNRHRPGRRRLALNRDERREHEQKRHERGHDAHADEHVVRTAHRSARLPEDDEF